MSIKNLIRAGFASAFLILACTCTAIFYVAQLKRPEIIYVPYAFGDSIKLHISPKAATQAYVDANIITNGRFQEFPLPDSIDTRQAVPIGKTGLPYRIDVGGEKVMSFDEGTAQHYHPDKEMIQEIMDWSERKGSVQELRKIVNKYVMQ